MKLVKSEPGNSDFGWIGRGIEVVGDITFADRLQIDGKVNGKLASESGTLIIGETGQLEAQIDVGVCVVHGELRGNVITPVLLVEEGAVFNGAIRMTQEAGGKLLEEVRLEGVDAEGRRQARGA